MAVEIGSLIVRGTFGEPVVKSGISREDLEEHLLMMRQTMRDEMRDMIEEAARRTRDR